MRVSSWGDECERWWWCVTCNGKNTMRDMSILYIYNYCEV